MNFRHLSSCSTIVTERSGNNKYEVTGDLGRISTLQKDLGNLFQIGQRDLDMRRAP